LELTALQILALLLERPTDDSIEIAVGFTREVGAFLQDNSPKANATAFERFRAVSNEGNISHHVQYIIEVHMQVRKDKDNPIFPEGPDLVEEEKQITHEVQLEEDLKVEEGLSTYPISCTSLRSNDLLADIFKFDANYIARRGKYKDESDDQGRDSRRGLFRRRRHV
jgi:pre-mRNA-splicing factor CWC22